MTTHRHAVEQRLDLREGERIAFQHRGIPNELGQHLMEAEAGTIHRMSRNGIRHHRSVPSKAKRIKEIHRSPILQRQRRAIFDQLIRAA